MTTISAKIIADSISNAGKRITTLQLRYPLIIHAESKTHRLLSESGESVAEEFVSPGVMNDPALSRNARSSRAVPIERMIQEVVDDPFIPLHWGAAQPGMQAYQECDAPIEIDEYYPVARDRTQAWLAARDFAVSCAKGFAAAGYAKQIVNRLLNPFLHIDTLVTATEWDNFFELRLHHAAEPHMRKLAEAMKAAMDESTPVSLGIGQWHLPYVSPGEDLLAHGYLRHDKPFHYRPSDGEVTALLRKVSAARCARISYRPFEGLPSIGKDLILYDALVGSRPLHASPVEHQATPDIRVANGVGGYSGWWNERDHRNFVGWRQNRAFVEAEALKAAA